MGGPGAGKGTQAMLLEKALSRPQIASGDLFREHMKNRTKLGRAAKVFIDRGNLVPDEITIGMVRERLTRADCVEGAILDGFPRTICQADSLTDLLSEIDSELTLVPYIHVSPDVLLKRLSGRWTCRQSGHVFHSLFSPSKVLGICDYDGSSLYQREDDTEETQKRRIVVYFDETRPLLDYYRQRGILAEINGEQSIEDVQKDLLQAIRNAESL